MKPLALNEFETGYTGIFDSHAHYDSAQFDGDRDEVLSALKENGICGVIDVGCDLESSFKAAELARTVPGFYASVGYHPHDAENFTEEGLLQIAELTKEPRVIAIGEIGLDYHYDLSPREKQKEVFGIQLKLAKELDLPVIIHSREATQDTLETLAKYPGLRGVVHCFSGSAETAKELLKMGFHIGFTGVITFPNARKILEACEIVPLDRILLETDCPYMSPVPYRGKRCWSPLIRFTAEKAAELHGVGAQQLIDAARENTIRLFGIENT